MSMTNGNGRSAGFTISDLMAMTLTLAVAAAIPAAAVGQFISSGRRAACQANLASHGVAFQAYKTEYQGKLPALVKGGDPGQPLGPATAVGGPDDTLRKKEFLAALGTNAMQNVWLMIAGTYIGGGDAAYKCPADRDWRQRRAAPGREDKSKFGWTSPNEFSYGLHFPYAGTTQGKGGSPDKFDATWNWADPNGVVSADSESNGRPMYPDSGVYMADRNPRATWASAYPGNSNHEDSVGYVTKGGSGEMVTTTDGKIGSGQDDIYVNRNAATPGGLPYVAPDGKDAAGRAKAPCSDTVVWPLDKRERARK